jgi:hypothetical protein
VKKTKEKVKEMQFKASLSSLFFPIPILFDLKLGVPVRARVPCTNCFGERVGRSIVCCKQSVRGSGVPIEWFVLYAAKHGAKSELALLLGTHFPCFTKCSQDQPSAGVDVTEFVNEFALP